MTRDDQERIFNAWKERPVVAASPPAGFDVRLDALRTHFATQLWEMVEGGLMDGYILDGKRWVRRSDVQHYLAAGDCAYDPLSSAYMPLAPEAV